MNIPETDSDESLWEGTVFGELAREGRVLQFARKRVLITEGDESNTLYLILSGRVKIYTSDPAGKELILGERVAGDILGEMSMNGGVRSASVAALETTRCAVIPQQQFRERLMQSPELAMELIDLLIRRGREVTKTAKDLALSNVYTRVVNLLLNLAETDENGVFRVREAMSQQDIARRVGSSRDMVNRIFKDLTQGDYIALEEGSLIIKRKFPANW